MWIKFDGKEYMIKLTGEEKFVCIPKEVFTINKWVYINGKEVK